MEQINLHFTGDFHAITSAHNLLSAMIDNHIYWGNKLNIDDKRIVWKRVMDMNDRALRFIDINTNGVAKSFKRIDGFDITVASEVMAIFCLSNDLQDLEKKIGIPIFFSKSCKSLERQKIAITSEATVISKPSILLKLFATPFVLISINLKARSFISITLFQTILLSSILSLLPQ